MYAWLPFRRAFHNAIFHGGLEEFGRNSTRWSHGLNVLIILSIILFITWPKEAYLNLRDLPFTYNALGGATLIMLAYINLSQGSRKLLGEQYMSLRDWLALAPLRADTFVRGYLAAGFLECGFFWGLSLPLLVLAAGVSGESLAALAAGAGIILICVGSYRTVAVALLLCLERDEFLLYLLIRCLFVLFLLVSGFILPVCNPVLAFVDASLWHERHALPSVMLTGLEVPGWVVTVGLHLLLGGLFYIIATVRARWSRRQAIHAGVTGGEVEGGRASSF